MIADRRGEGMPAQAFIGKTDLLLFVERVSSQKRYFSSECSLTILLLLLYLIYLLVTTGTEEVKHEPQERYITSRWRGGKRPTTAKSLAFESETDHNWDL